jgi:hypothetical protein
MNKVLEGFKAMGLGEKIIVVAGVVLFIDGFLPWYDVDLGFASVTRSGWESPGAFWSIIAVLIGLAMAAVVAVKNLTDVAIPDNVSGVTWPKIYLGGGVTALVFVLIKWLNENSYMGFGFYLGIIAAAALAGAGFYAFQQEKAKAS